MPSPPDRPKYPRQIVERNFRSQRHLWKNKDEFAALLELVDNVFYASLGREEGEPARVSVVWSPDGIEALSRVVDADPAYACDEEGAPLTWDVVRIAPQLLTPEELIKSSPTVRAARNAIVVGRHGRKLRIEGFARRRYRTDGGSVLRISAPMPGVLVFERQLQELLRIEAGRVIRTPAPVLSEEEGLISPVVFALRQLAEPLASEHRVYSNGVERFFEDLVTAVARTGKGGVIAVADSTPPALQLARLRIRLRDPDLLASAWAAQQSAAGKWLNAGMAAHHFEKATAAALQSLRDAERERAEANRGFESAIADVAGLSAIDGAVLMVPSLRVLGAGYFIKSKSRPRVVEAFDIEGAKTAPFSHITGARHQAAFAFAYDNPDGLAFVISEDGRAGAARRENDSVLFWPIRISET